MILAGRWVVCGRDIINTCALQAKMRDPVTASDGISYERAALAEWVAEHGTVSPTTKEEIAAEFVPNDLLRSLLEALQHSS